MTPDHGLDSGKSLAVY